MKFGCCLGLTAGEYDGLIKIKECGAEFIETSLANLSTFSDNEISELVEVTESLAMPCVAANAVFSGPSGQIKLVGKNIDHSPAAEHIWSAFDKISKTKIKHITIGSGAARRCPEDMSLEEAVDQFAAFLSDVMAPAAEKYGLVCGIEALNSHETNVITTCKEAFSLVKAVNKPQIKMIVDYYHFTKENERLEDLENYKGYVSHMHIAGLTNGRKAPMPTDNEGYGDFVTAMRKIGCDDGYLAIEGGIPEPFHQTLATSLAFLNTL